MNFLPQSSNTFEPPTIPPAPKQLTHHLKRGLWLVIAGIVVLAGGGVGYVAYSQGYLHLPFLQPNTASLADKMAASIANIKNAQYGIRVHLATEPRDPKAQPLTKNLNTNLDELIPESGWTFPLLDQETLLRSVPTDLQLNAGMTLYADTEAEKGGNGSVTIDGSYTGGDLTLEASVEGRKIGDPLYVFVKKFPALFFFDFSAVKNKWIKIEKSDTESFLSFDFADNENNKKTAAVAQDTLRAVFSRGLFALDRELPAETIAGIKTEHYRLTVHPEKLTDVYQDIIDGAKKRGEETKQLDEAVENLKDPSTQKLLKNVAEQSSYEIWIEPRTGMPRQAKWMLALVPPDSLERLKGKQLSLSFQLTLEHVNQKVTVDKPNSAIDFDEATRLLYGISKEEQQFEKQTGQIRMLKSVFSVYHDKQQTYPDSLEQLNKELPGLAQKCKDATAANTNVNGTGIRTSYDYSCTLIERYAENPPKTIDVYTDKPYGYTKDGDAYTLIFEIQYFDGMSEYEKKQYVEGANTEKGTPTPTQTLGLLPSTSSVNGTNSNTAKDVNAATDGALIPDTDSDGLNNAQEQLYGSDPTKTDTDSDGLPDYDEVIKYQTKPEVKDSDTDGYDDFTEVTGGYNPTGTGKATTEQTQLWDSKPSFRNGPTIGNSTVNQTAGYATVYWTLSEAGDGIVNYGTTAGYGNVQSDYAFINNHTIRLPVVSRTTYHYSIRSCTNKPNSRCSSTADAIFIAQ